MRVGGCRVLGVGEGGVGEGAWPVIMARSEYTGRVDFHTIAPT